MVFFIMRHVPHRTRLLHGHNKNFYVKKNVNRKFTKGKSEIGVAPCEISAYGCKQSFFSFIQMIFSSEFFLFKFNTMGHIPFLKLHTAATL